METGRVLVTQAEYAARRGVTKSAVSKWKAAGLLVTVRNGRRDLVDVVASDQLVDESVDPLRGRPGVAPAPGQIGVAPTSDLGAVRLELIKAQTVRHHLENDRRAGELVALVEFEALAADWARRSRERMHAIVRQLAERLAARTEPRQIIALLSAEIDAAFDGLAMEAEAEAQGEALSAVESADIVQDDAVADALVLEA